MYYSFCDDNVLYDAQYAGIFERQNDSHVRIKEETPYIESLVLFENIENTLNDESTGEMNFYSSDVTPAQKTARKDKFRVSAPIGDGFINGEPQKAPAFKIALLQGEITSSNLYDTQYEVNIPQINIDVTYNKKTIDPTIMINPQSIAEIDSQTPKFKDGKSVAVIPQELVLYMEEMNTDLLMENFELEVFYSTTGSDDLGNTVLKLERKYFKTSAPQIVNGLLVSERPDTNGRHVTTTDNVEYYFDVFIDEQVNNELACKGADIFNKETYYIDLGFDCDLVNTDVAFYDIYGAETEPEICQ
jgi:hypothetical protein